MKKVALFGAAGAAVFVGQYFLIKQNHELFEESKLVGRDDTRPFYKSYGLRYGFKTDMAIETLLDTGDLFFAKFECSRWLTV
jgi:hypothetical protein